MTNIFGKPEKGSNKARLFEIGVQALEREGWTVNRIPKLGKSSVRGIARSGESHVVSIRTTQDTYIAFPRTPDDKEWVTLDIVDVVIAVSVDDPHAPRTAQVHWIEGEEMRERFDRAYAARKAAGHKIPVGRGMWLGLYLPDSLQPTVQVGAGAGLANPPFAKVPLAADEIIETDPEDLTASDEVEPAMLMIEDYRQRLGEHFGVPPEKVRITIEV